MTSSQFDDWLGRPPRRPLLMGVLNVTPDSFSDGGLHFDPSAAISHARRMRNEGADLIDVGGESTRPGSSPVPEDVQIRRILPVVAALAVDGFALSIDTTRAAVAEAALDAGACLINDISAARDDPTMLPMAARRGRPIILMHMQGTPATMQQEPKYQDVTAEVVEFLQDRIQAAVAAGVARGKILIDPGIGFGKTTAHNLELLKELNAFSAVAAPIVVGTSRKRFIGQITGEPNAADRLFGGAAAVAWSVAHGAAIVRVHDVRATAQVIRMTRAIQQGKDFAPETP